MNNEDLPEIDDLGLKPIDMKKTLENTMPTVIGNKKDYLSNGLTKLQEIFCRMVAQQPEELMTPTMAGEIYKQIPGVTTENPTQAAYALLKIPKVVNTIAAYRAVLNLDPVSMKVKHLELYETFRKRFEDDPDAKVKASDVISALKELNGVMGFTKQNDNSELTIVLKNERINEAFDAINITPEKKK